MLKPIGSFILVEVYKEEKKTASGIYLADGMEFDTTLRGYVHGVGKDVKEISKGQSVVFPRECGVTVKDDDKEFVVLKESNVLAIDY